MPNPIDAPVRLLRQLERVRTEVTAGQQALLRQWRAAAPLGPYAEAAANLAAYIALRRLDLTALQPRLAAFGLSSLGRCEAHVLPTLEAVAHALGQLGRHQPAGKPRSWRPAADRGHPALVRATDRLLGAPPASRGTRFMVTLPTEAAADPAIIDALVEHGMDCARINAAHDTPQDWLAMVGHVRRAAERQRRNVKILVDLPGPKLRTGSLPAREPVLHMKVSRDERGQLVAPARVILDGSGLAGGYASGTDEADRISVPAAWVRSLSTTDTITFQDLRSRRRVLAMVKRIDRERVLAQSERGAYLAPGMRMERRSQTGERTGCVIGEIAALPVDIRVHIGDRLLLSPVADAGRAARRDAEGRIVEPACIGCVEASIFQYLQPGHHVKIDDGKIDTVVERVDHDGALLHVVQAPPKGARLGPDKGLNFPDTPLPAHGLDQRDRAPLHFAAAHADIVGYSFVQSADEMEALHRTLRGLTRRRLGIIAKIETATAIENLPGIIVRGASQGPFGVMIARGDLAVEIGYLRLAEVQEELMWLCEAARVPVVWATQVLEGMIKRGSPSRAEMTDAASAQRAECIMLNKGPYLPQALDLLSNLVGRMARHQSKKTARFTALDW